MITDRPLSLFISSKMQELAEERRAVQSALKEYEMHGWLWEDDAGARPEPIRSTYLEEVKACDIYIGLFWLGYGLYTFEEYQYARSLKKPCLIYEKYVNVEQRSQELEAFLQDIQQVANPEGLTVCRFETPEQFARQVQTDVVRLLTTQFRESRRQPQQLTPCIWNVPFHRNRFFTGRENLLQQLHTNFTMRRAVALTQAEAINGLGGIGKTQIALEYAYRHRDTYQAVLWIRAATVDILKADYVTIADLLDLSEKDDQDQNIIVEAVKRWLATHDNWLLIFDNADDLNLAREFLPTNGRGHILLTTRVQAVGSLAHSIEVEKLDMEDGVLFLLRRTRVLTLNTPLGQIPKEERVEAEQIVREMDGLPLALDQAGAYIEETGCSIATYLERYRQRQTTLLKRRGESSSDHPESVAITWSLSFEQVERLNPTAAELLRLCAFLSPDTIPEEMILEGATELGSQLQLIANDPTLLDEAIATLRRFSLIHRNSTDNTLSIHRLVQVVLESNMSEGVHRQWSERIVRAINQAWPSDRHVTWSVCLRYLPHAYVCAVLIAQWDLVFPEAAHLLSKAGDFALQHALYEDTDRLYRQALTVHEKALGLEHPDNITILNKIATLCRALGHYAEAEQLYQLTLSMCEKSKEEGGIPLLVALILSNLGALYNDLNQYEKAEWHFQKALSIREKELGPYHPDVVFCLNGLAYSYKHQNKNDQAERLYLQTLAIREQTAEPTKLEVALILSNLGKLYKDQGNYVQAEVYYTRALNIREQALNHNHSLMAYSHNNLGMLYLAQGQNAKAEPHLQIALEINEQVLGDKHLRTQDALRNYALLLRKIYRYEEAAKLEARLVSPNPEHSG